MEGEKNERDMEELQFDQAEFEGEAEEAGPACGACSRPIVDEYYETDGKVICETCKEEIEKAQTGGSGIGRFFKALLFGAPAAAVGAGIYYGISALTGYEFGLVAIVIGLMVGGAVRLGSNRKGGWVYQGLAMLLTYTAIVATYVPYIIEGVQSEMDSENSAVVERSETDGSGNVEENTVSETEHRENVDEALSDEEASPVAEMDDAVLFSAVLLAMVALVALAFAAPFLAGFDNIIGLIIIGIGLYEAWKLNKRVEIVINGPFSAVAGNASVGNGGDVGNG